MESIHVKLQTERNWMSSVVRYNDSTIEEKCDWNQDKVKVQRIEKAGDSITGGWQRAELRASGVLSRGEGVSCTSGDIYCWGCLLRAAKVQHKVKCVRKGSQVTLCHCKVLKSGIVTLRQASTGFWGSKGLPTPKCKKQQQEAFINHKKKKVLQTHLWEAATSLEMVKDMHTQNP